MTTGLGLALLGAWLPVTAAYLSKTTTGNGVFLAAAISGILTFVLLHI